MPNLEDFSVEMLRELVKKHREAVEKQDRAEQLRLREEANKIVESIKILLIEAAKRGVTRITLRHDSDICMQMNGSLDLREEVKRNLSCIGLNLNTIDGIANISFEMNPQD